MRAITRIAVTDFPDDEHLVLVLELPDGSVRSSVFTVADVVARSQPMSEHNPGDPLPPGTVVLPVRS